MVLCFSIQIGPFSRHSAENPRMNFKLANYLRGRNREKRQLFAGFDGYYDFSGISEPDCGLTVDKDRRHLNETENPVIRGWVNFHD
jgi:hypothetical protein